MNLNTAILNLDNVYNGRINMKKAIILPYKPNGNWLIISNRNDDQSKFFYENIREASKTFEIEIPPLQYTQLEKYDLKGRNKDEIMEYLPIHSSSCGGNIIFNPNSSTTLVSIISKLAPVLL